MKYDIFISYKRLDKDKVFPIKDFIERNTGYNCWIDLDGIESDAQFADIIIKAINNAEVFLFMYSKTHSKIENFEEDWTVKEINFAQMKKKRIVFVNLDNTPLTDRFYFMFSTKQQVAATSDVAMKKLCADIKQWLRNEDEERLEQERIEREKREAEVKRKAEQERLERERREAEQKRLEQERIERERREAEAKRKAEMQKSVSNMANGHEYVDLGLPSGLKWATCNVGSNKPEDYGDYFAWGELKPKQEYTDQTYEHYISFLGINSSSMVFLGEISGNTQYDTARVKWGGKWRIPTLAELKELCDKCTWTWMSQNGVEGYKVTGPNGNSIFLPAAGYRDGSSLYDAGSLGNYWSSTPFEYDESGAFYLKFDSADHGGRFDYRGNGRSVRPVLE
ncbi:MAG: TIR domain-containing protein [Bacteroidales bacterium]|nr:TIR domain-containing protein [Bacteroidales bacterium]